MLYYYILLIFAGIVALASTRSQLGDVVLSAKAGDECDMRKDVLLVEDVANENAYLQCRPAGRGVVGSWQWMPCSKGERFFFSEQRCLTTAPRLNGRSTTASTATTVKGDRKFTAHDTTGNRASSTSTLAPETTVAALSTVVAFVNQSCANGDQCAGGSVCDPVLLICKCPPGTILSDQDGITCQSATSTIAITTTPKQVAPGSSCGDTGTQCGGGSFCSEDNNVCTCPEGYMDSNGQCSMVQIQAVPPGGKCDSFSYCIGGAVCSKGTCLCNPPMKQNGDQCTEETTLHAAAAVSGPGQPCDQARTCIGGSLCSAVTLLCECPEGTKDNGNNCTEAVQVPADLGNVGDHCGVNSDCVAGAFCSATSCQCLSTHIQVDKSCYRIIFPGERGCESNDQCFAGFQGSQCVNDVCTCPAGMDARARTCQPASTITVGPGQSCSSNSTTTFNCSGGAVCIKNVCVCPRGRVLSGDTCKKRNQSGSSQSTTAITTTATVKTVQGSQMSRAIPFSSPGGNCAAGQRCQGGSICRDGWCVCPDKDMIVHNGTCAFGPIKAAVPIWHPTSPNPAVPVWHPTPPTLPESPIAFPGYYVQPGFQSLMNTNFIPGSPGVYVPNTPGLPVFPVPSPPDQPIPLLPGLLPAGIRPSHRPFHNDIVNVKERETPRLPSPAALLMPKRGSASSPPGSPCGDSVTCTGGSTCQNGQCICDERYEITDQLCVRERQHNKESFSSSPGTASPLESCANGEQCLGGSLCDGESCQCPGGTGARQGLCQAIPRTVSGPNGSCADGQQCVGGSWCNRAIGQCQCPSSTVPVGSQCLPLGRLVPAQPNPQSLPQPYKSTNRSVPMENRVTAPEQERVNTVLQQKVINTEGPISIQGVQRMSLSIPGGPCNITRQCSGGAVCKQGICKCPNGLVSVNGTCGVSSSRADVGGLCSPVTECGGHSTCINGRCRCPPGTMQTGPTCVPLSGGAWTTVGVPCGSKVTCGNNAMCKNGTCICEDGYEEYQGSCQLSKTLPVLHSSPGDPCVTIDDCTGGSYCRLGFCVCPLGTESVQARCVSVSDTIIGNSQWIPPGGSPPSNTPVDVGGIPQQLFVPPSTYIDPGTRIPYYGGGSIRMNTDNGNGGIISSPRSSPVQKPLPLPNVGPGQPCGSNGSCSGGSVCSMGLCSCPAGLKTSVNGDVCEPDGPFVPPGSLCTTGQTCTGGSYCVTGICLCPPGQEIRGYECRPTVPFTAIRKDTVSSKRDHSRLGIPARGLSARPNGRFARPNEPCPKGVTCTGGSVCYQDQRCRCIKPLTLKNGLCRRDQQHLSASPHFSDCDPRSCSLPNCYCTRTGREPPSSLALDDTPQFVVLTFDDAVNKHTLGPFMRLFQSRRYLNRNGCPLRATFFVSHEGTDYSDVQALYVQGHELASNSITHTDLRNERIDRWVSEIHGQRRIMANLANIDQTDIVGFRAPQLEVAGDATFEMMQQSNFLYDNSISVNPGLNQAPYWPQTLDYVTAWDCRGPSCPRRPFPGLWIVPLNQYYTTGTHDRPVRGAMIRAALSEGETEDSLYQLLRHNFYRSYDTNKAPYILTLDGDLASSLPANGTLNALERFLNEAAQKPDVWFVTIRQLIDWMRSPVPVYRLINYGPFLCSRSEGERRSVCDKPKRCQYWTRRLTKKRHSFKTCSRCPKNYPWIDNVDGQ